MAAELQVRRFGTLVLPIIILLGALILLSSSVIIVGAGERGAVFDTFRGVLEDSLSEGFHVLVPFVQKGYRFDVRTQTYTLSGAPNEGQVQGNDTVEAHSRDGQSVKVDLSVRYSLDPEKVWWILKKVGPDMQSVEEKIVRPEITSVVRNSVPSLSATDLYSNVGRLRLEKEMTNYLKDSFGKNNIQLDEVLLRNLVFSDEFQKSIEAKQVALQNAQQMQYVLQKERQEKQRKVIEAEGESQAIRLKGMALAQNPRLIQYEYVQKLTPGVRAIITNQSSILNLGDFLKGSEAEEKH